MTRKQKRLAVISGGIGFLVAAVLLVMFAFSQSIAYFYVPGDLAKADVAPGTRIRLGGLVESGTVKRGEGSTVTFTVTDTLANVPVTYTGILPGFLGYVFYNRAVGEVGASRASLFIHLMPVFGTLLSAIFLAEIPQTYHFAGIALIFSGIYLTTSHKAH